MLVSTSAIAQNWQGLKNRIKADSENDKKKVEEFAKRQKRPISFFDGRNHFLMRAVHPSGKPIYLTTLNAGAAITSGAATIQQGVPGFTLDGSGLHIFQWDAGLVKVPHIEYDTRLLHNEGDISNHATHVAGTLVSAGVNNAAAKGMAPNAYLHAYYYDDDLNEMIAIAESNPYGFFMSNHSYGSATGWQKVGNVWEWEGDDLVSTNEDYTAGNYTTRTQQIDELAALAPYYTIVWAAGNDRGDVGSTGHPRDCNGGTGYDCIIQESTAKNIITVGAVTKVLSYTDPTSVVMSSFSSWGPTDDGRIKPDLVGAGVNLFSTSAGLGGGTNTYTTMSGTSQATPNVSGSLMLLQDLYGQLNGGQWMRASTLKALAIHSVKETGLARGPDYSFGWGLLDVAEGARLISQRDDENIFIAEHELLNGETHQWTLQPQANTKIKITLVWTDPAGLSPGAVLDPTNAMLVNDLDIRLVDENNDVQFPWILDSANPANPATRGDNIRDNVEKLEFDLPDNKPYKLTVSHKGTLTEGSQLYSIIIEHQSSVSGKNFYWIGGSGNWSDGTHWSLSTGGVPANVIPGIQDNVFVDENSFSGYGLITLDTDVSCRAYKWLRKKGAGIYFNNQRLTVGKELTMVSDSLVKNGYGGFILNSLDSGVVNSSYNVVLPLMLGLKVTSGRWRFKGHAMIDSLEIAGGEAVLENSSLTMNRFLGVTSGTKFIVNNSAIHLRRSWTSDQSKIDIQSNESIMTIDSMVTFSDVDSKWNGALALGAEARLDVTGRLTFDSLHLSAGATVQISSASAITVREISIDSSTDFPVSLISSATGSLELPVHKKFCLDNIHVSNVNLTGQAVVNLGSNSTIQNSTGWQQGNCDDALFPDFTFQYNCLLSNTEFVNASTGLIDSYHWDFGDPSSAENESSEENSNHLFTETDSYNVSLTISNQTQSATFVQTVSIIPNTLPEVEVDLIPGTLTSSVEGESYQWFKDGVVLVNAVDRDYEYDGAAGLYSVLVYDSQCNRQSAGLVITGVDKINFESFEVYPVPAADLLYFNIADAQTLALVDCFGRLQHVPWNAREGWANVSSLENGLYVLKVQKDGKELVKRILVKR
jgi:PKD repeat protein